MILHGVIDMFAGMLPAILPVLRMHFHLSLTLGVLLIAVLNFFANGVQIAAGHLREKSETSFFMRLAFPLSAFVCIMYLVPAGWYALSILVAIMIVTGTGVAVFHPESMRAIHSFDKIPSSVATPFVVMGGYFGFCGGGWIGAELVDDGVGLKGLRYMLVVAAVGFLVALVTKFRLAVDEDSHRDTENTEKRLDLKGKEQTEEEKEGTTKTQRHEGKGLVKRKEEEKTEEEIRQDNRIDKIIVKRTEKEEEEEKTGMSNGQVSGEEKLDPPSGLYGLRAGSADKPEDDPKGRQGEIEDKRKVAFWPLFFMASWICTGTAVTVSLLPTHIYESGLELDFGGFSSFMFGAGIGIGGVLWGIIAHRIGELLSSVLSVMIGLPFLVVYFLLSNHKPAVIILLVCGFCIGGAYPMLVSMAMHAKGMNLGRRMGLMVGGVWGVASLLLIAAGSIADILGTFAVLFGSAATFLIGGIYGIYLLRTGYGQNAEVGTRNAE
ncbi:MFS transporter [Planctomycetota bacterium]